MRLKVGQAVDALYLALTEGSASHSEEVAPGMVVDYGEQGHIVGIEVLYLTKRAPEAEPHTLLFETIPSTR